ncbi:alpha-L-fucosidase [Sphingomonas sp.]|jgi:alpha-L-fucosidase|uniref:alpha-L-fucosidase n=1 Tax=Sphingomonas sp. TaxID=28214 RepID=UPI002ED995B2
MVDQDKRSLLGASLLGALALPYAARGEAAPAQADKAVRDLPMASGPFMPTPASLKTYQTPEWFRDAKFGIWSHWGPQAVPRQGDWYARHMYIYGHPHYEHHLKTYGHPTKHGYKDIIPLWKAEKFDPDALMALYDAAGAKYFVSMGVHHDNFDLWNSKHHRWNSVAMGPKRDIVGDWRKAALKRGLRFGVSEHLGPSYSWFSASHLYDQVWPLGGVSYDGADPRFADLYHPAHDEPFRWGRSWYAKNPAWHRQWYNRVRDLIDSYQPDYLYTDGGIPFEIVGRTMLAHFYNQNRAKHGGSLEAVYAYKDLGTGEFYKEAGVEDVERGVMSGINPLPWQTDTSIGDWFYSDGFKYKTTTEIVAMLADVVSKNGNLLINVVQYADGSLPPECRTFLSEMAAWMAINREAIHGTRPWTVFGEGPTRTAEGAFKENAAYTPQDIRFTTKGDALYAIALGVPAGPVAIGALGRVAGHERRPVRSVRLLGTKRALRFEQTDRALVVDVAGAAPVRHAACFRIGF